MCPEANIAGQARVTAWYRRDPRSSPIGVGALLLSVVGSSTYIAGVALPIVRGTIAAVLDDRTHNADVMISIISSGVSILLSLLSLAFERAPAPALLALLLLVVVENVLFIMMPIWTWMVAQWGLGLLYSIALAAAFVLALRRVVRKLSFKTR
jgi:hypothetical protein